MYTRRILVSVLALTACHGFDTSREQIVPLSVGHEMFGVMCDRVVAANFPEDIEGTKYAKVCRPGPDNRYEVLPAVPNAAGTTPALEKQRIAQGRLQALVARRSELILAFNQMFPEEEPGFLTGFKKLLGDMAPLYDREMPTVIGSLDGILANVEASDAAVQSLTKISNREGYRPMQATAGALAALASQSQFAETTAGLMKSLQAGSGNEAMLNQFLAGMQTIIADSKNSSTSGFGKTLADVVLFEDDSLYQAGPETYVVKRDSCGFAAFAPQSKYARTDNSCATTDQFGRMLDNAGRPVKLPTPFSLQGVTDTVLRDEFGRAVDADQNLPSANNQQPTIYQYTNVSKTALTSLVAESRSLFQPDRPALNDVLTNLGPLLGERTTRIDQQVGFQRRLSTFGADSAPAMDFALAAAPALKAMSKDNFAALDALANGLEANSRTGQRLVASMVNAKNLANADTYAKYLTTSTFWDELNDILTEIADARDASNNPVPLLEEVLEAMGDPQVQYMAKATSDAFQYKDRYAIDKDNPNGPVKNLTNPGHAPGIAVDRTVADGGLNASNFQRLIKVIAESGGVKFCNKNGAAMPGFDLAGLQRAPCDLFEVKDMAAFFMQAIAVHNPDGSIDDSLVSRGKGVFPLTDGVLQAVGFLSPFLSGSDRAGLSIILQNQTGLNEMGVVPTAPALARLLFMQRPVGRSATAAEEKVLSFAESIGEPAPSTVCPVDTSFGTPQCPAACLLNQNDPSCTQCTKPKLYGLRKCDATQTLAARNPEAIFVLEQNNMMAALRPIIRPFVKHDKEYLFLKLMSALNRHWASARDPDCQRSGDPTLNGAYCAQSGLNSYEPLLAKMFSEKADLLPALRQAVIDLQPQGGARKLAPIVRALFSRMNDNLPLNLHDRLGVFTSKRNDGFDNAYLTPATLIVKALDEMDAKRKADAAGFARWKASRSALIDTLFAFDMIGDDVSTASLRSQAMTKVLPRALRATAKSLRERAAKPDFAQWINNGGFAADVQEVLTNPTLFAGLELLKGLRSDPSVERNLLATMYGALDPTDGAQFLNIAAGLVDSLQGLQDSGSLDALIPLFAPAFEASGETKVVGTAVVPAQGGMLKATIDMLAKTAELDPDHRFSAVMSRMVTPFPGTVSTPLSVITSTIGEVARADPTKKGEAYTDTDTRRVLDGVREFLNDEQTGMRRLINIVQQRSLRNLPPR